ncbi:MAG: His/Gly/Thr/Pro-type tRNA ligase C-terminal domain-containing protein [Candidatus Caldarchaeum sp.]
MPAVGCAIGITRIQIYLSERSANYTENHDVVVSVVSDGARGYGLHVADFLRKKGFSVLFDVSRKRLSDVIENTFNRGIRYLVIIGDREKEERKVTLRDLSTRTQFTESAEDIVSRMVWE